MQRGGGPIVWAGQANGRKAAGGGGVALRAWGGGAGGVWSCARLPRLPGAQSRAGGFPRPARDAPKGANGTGCRGQDNQSGFANKLQFVHVRTIQVHPAGPRRLERLSRQTIPPRRGEGFAFFV